MTTAPVRVCVWGEGRGATAPLLPCSEEKSGAVAAALAAAPLPTLCPASKTNVNAYTRSPRRQRQVSVGGKDRAVFQWRVVRHEARPPEPLAVPWAQVDDKGLMWAAPNPAGAAAPPSAAATPPRAVAAPVGAAGARPPAAYGPGADAARGRAGQGAGVGVGGGYGGAGGGRPGSAGGAYRRP